MKKILRFEVEENELYPYCSPKNCPIFDSCDTAKDYIFGIPCEKYNLATLTFIGEEDA